MPPGEYARAFALNFVFFLAAILVYALFIPTATTPHIIILAGLSIYFTVARNAQPVEQLADLRAAAMHDHRVEAERFQQDDIARKHGGQSFIDHGVPAIFHDDDLPDIALNIGQRL